MVMYLEVLGPIRVIGPDGSPVDVGPPRVRRLLARLALEPDRSVSLNALEDAMWDGDQAPARPDKAIQDTVADLRAALRRAARPSFETPDLPHGEFSVTRSSTPSGYSLLGASGRTDAAMAEVGWRQISSSGSPPLERKAEAEAMLALWRGRPYSDLGELPAAVAERSRLDTIWWQAQDVRFTAAADLGDMVTLAEAAALLADDASHWRIWAAWMRGLADAGLIADSLAVFQKARNAWADRGVDLAPELVALEQRIASGTHRSSGSTNSSALSQSATDLKRDPSPSSSSETTSSETTSTFASPAPSSPSSLPPSSGGRAHRRPRPVCVGRESSVESLNRAYQRAAAGNVQFVAITGEQGIGKTTLLRTFLAEAGTKGAATIQVLEGACFDDEIEPYAPMASVIRSALTVAEEAGLLATINVAGHHALRRMVTNVTDSIDPDNQWPRDSRVPGDGTDVARQALVEVLRRLTTAGPVVLAVEDLHWLKEQGADLLLQVLRRIEGLPLMIVSTVRTRSSSPARLFRKVMEEAARHCEITEITVAGLSVDALAQLVQLHDPDEEHVHEVAAEFRNRTGGHPFYARELLRFAEEHRRSDNTVASSDPLRAVPPSVELVVRSRLENLQPDSIKLLDCACVIGPVWDVRVVAAMMGVTPAAPEFLSALDDSLDTGFARVKDAMSVEFAHEIVRHVIRDGLAPHRRYALHAQAATALANVGAPSSMISTQWLAAGAVADPEFAARSTIDAAKAEMNAFAFGSARERLDELRSWLTVHGALTTEREVEIELKAGDATNKLGLIDESKKHAQRAFELAQSLPIGAVRSDAVVSAAYTHLVYSTGADADPASLALARQCLDEDIPPLMRAILRARILIHEEQWSTNSLVNHSELDHLRSEAEILGDPDLHGEVAWASFHATRGAPNPSSRLALGQQLIVIGSGRTRSSRYTANGLRAVALSSAELGKRSDFEAAVRQLRQWSSDRGSRIYATDVLRWQAMAEGASGNWEAATIANDRLRELSLGQPLLLIGGELQRIQRQRRQGLDIDFEKLELAIQLAGGMSPMLRGLHGVIMIERNDPAAAKPDLEFLTNPANAGIPFSTARCPVDGLVPAAELVSAIGSDAEVAAVNDALLPYAGQLAVTWWGELCHGAVDRALARLAVRQDRGDDAARLFESALRLELQFGADAEAAVTQQARSTLLR